MAVVKSPAFFISGSDYKLRINKNLVPKTTDGASLGTTTLNWSDLFLDSGAVINFDSGDVTITHSANTLAFAGANAYTFDNDLYTANDNGYGGRDSASTAVTLIIANSADDAHFLANVGNGNILDAAFGGFNSDVPFQFGGACCGGSFPTSLDFRTTGNISFRSSDTENIRITTAANIKVGGTANRATTEGTNQLQLFNGTAPVGTLTNGISLYSASGEANVMDAAGNATPFSPHDKETNEWIFRSTHTPTGKTLRIEMERMMRKLNDMLGGGYIKEYVETPS